MIHQWQRAARLEPGGPRSQPQAGSKPKARSPHPPPAPVGAGALLWGQRWRQPVARRGGKPV